MFIITETAHKDLDSTEYEVRRWAVRRPSTQHRKVQHKEQAQWNQHWIFPNSVSILNYKWQQWFHSKISLSVEQFHTCCSLHHVTAASTRLPWGVFPVGLSRQVCIPSSPGSSWSSAPQEPRAQHPQKPRQLRITRKSCSVQKAIPDSWLRLRPMTEHKRIKKAVKASSGCSARNAPSCLPQHEYNRFTLSGHLGKQLK